MYTCKYHILIRKQKYLSISLKHFSYVACNRFREASVKSFICFQIYGTTVTTFTYQNNSIEVENWAFDLVSSPFDTFFIINFVFVNLQKNIDSE